MPTSDHRQISTVLDVVLKREPGAILDIGAGYGKYGNLLREYLPDATIVGVEPWEAYAETEDDRLRWWGYDAMVMNAWPEAASQAYTVGVGEGDIALMIDVIEHWPVTPTGNLVSQLTAFRAALRAARCVVIATPHDAMRWPQDDLPNPGERHYQAPTIAELVWMARQEKARLAECHWFPDSYVAVVERI